MRKKKEKTRTIYNNFYMLRQVAKYSPGYLVLKFFESVFTGLLGAVDAVYLKFLFDSIGNNAPVSDALKIVLLMVGFTVVTFAYYTISNYNYIQFKMQTLHYKMHSELLKHAGEMDVSCYDDPKFYTDFVMAMDESDARAAQVVGDSCRVVSSLISGVTILGVLVSVDFWIALIVFIVNCLNIVITRFANKLDLKHYELNKPITRKNQYISRVYYLVDAAKEIRISRISENLRRDYHECVKKTTDLQIKYGGYYCIISILSMFIRQATFSSILIYMTYSILVTKTMLLGGFAVAANSMWRLSWNMRSIIDLITTFHKHSLFIDKYRKFLDYKPKITGLDKKIPQFEKLTLKDATFAYNEENVLKNVDLEIKKGEKIAIVGYNGAGKSTLIKLLMRLYDVNSGQILWNGENIKNFDPAYYRKHIGAVFQDYKIFSATIAENVMGGEFDKKDEKIVLEALDRATFTEKLKTIDKGIYANLTREFDDDGITLSGGEAQKIAIARVFAHPYDLIIMDEPSSALDPIAEFELNRSISEYAKDKTVIFISHRLSTTRNAHRIYMFADGEVIESGSHNELIAQNGKYAEMFNMQAEKYNRKVDTLAQTVQV